MDQKVSDNGIVTVPPSDNRLNKRSIFSFEEERLWFTEGDEANFIFTEAASTAEVIARKPQKRKIMLKGQWV